MKKDLYKELIELEPGGVMAYVPLMRKLKECGDDKNRRKEVALSYLPMALLCALQNEECLQDIKNVAEKFPELAPAIFTCAIKLRNDKSTQSWTQYESAKYKDFIASVANRKPRDLVISRGGVGVFTDYRKNIIVDSGHPILRWKADKDRLRPSWFSSEVQTEFKGGLPKIGSQHSEDALTWNVFRTLQLNQGIHIITGIFDADIDVSKLYFWGGHDADQRNGKIDTDIQDILNQMESWGMNGVKQQTETDVILRGKRHIVMVECKLGERRKKVKAWQRSSIGMRPEYAAFIKKQGFKLFNDTFEYERDGNRFYQLFRNYLLGAALALKWNTGFSLLAIVNDLNSNREGKSHQYEFDSFRSVLAEPSNAFIITWQQIWKALPAEENFSSVREYMAKHPCLVNK